MGTTIGKGNTIFTIGGISIAVLVLVEVNAGVTVLDAILVSIFRSGVGVLLSIGGGLVSRGGGISRSRGVQRGVVSASSGDKSQNSDESLEWNVKLVAGVVAKWK